jgi:hypothetical protein
MEVTSGYGPHDREQIFRAWVKQQKRASKQSNLELKHHKMLIEQQLRRIQEHRNRWYENIKCSQNGPPHRPVASAGQRRLEAEGKRLAQEYEYQLAVEEQRKQCQDYEQKLVAGEEGSILAREMQEWFTIDEEES